MSHKPSAADAARGRREQGHKIHVTSFDVGSKMFSGGPQYEFADHIEEVESAGWKLDTLYQGPGKAYLIFRATA